MHRLLFFAALGPVILGMTGCAAPEPKLTPREFTLTQDVLRESPAFRAATEGKCAEGFLKNGMSGLAETAVFLKVAPEDVPAVVCKRLVHALAIGKITYADMQAMQENRASPTLRTRILEIMLVNSGGTSV